MPSIAPIVAQGIGGLGAIALAVFCPQPGSTSVLVPLGAAGEAAAADWAMRERAQLVGFDASARRVSVIAPTTLSLVHALGYGFVPVASDPSACAAPARATSPTRDKQQQG